ncbi:uncharacterized protein LOC132716321 isoform X3 [Ruditapes philippinarum]|uniref:uncharacterized protein LOC132716321 isoform X3 n=1 Tax=Ruditapes philippinarum TaxID=129788 RepID=UPI00295B5608|nr:uncharacterized protein LOC132716321 isoform X3 [Ruditapes philippinarum]
MKRNQLQQKNTKDYLLTPRQNTQQSRRLSVASYNQGGFNPLRSSAADTFGDNADLLSDDETQKKTPAWQQKTSDLPMSQKKRSIGEKSTPLTFRSFAKKVTMNGNKSRRKSKNVGTTERPALETWEDLLNVQPEPYKEKPGSGNIGFQMGVITKFMRWYRKVEDAVVTEREKRRASIVPQHGPIDNIHEKGTVSDKSEKGDRESTYTQPRPGSATQPTEKVKKLPIWLQVAQEKSTVYQDVTQSMPNPETTVQRCKRNLNKVKRSVQKENEAQLEKIVRERLATFRLKLLALNQEECSPLFEKEILKLDDKKGNVKLFHLENFDVQPSKWYEELKEQTMGMMSSYPQPEIADMLTKLQIYSHMDNKTLSYSKAKLCLLVMSLPAYDICQIYMQKALKFIFENIMLGQDTQLNEWLNHRKIPNVVTTDIFSRPESPFTDPD